MTHGDKAKAKAAKSNKASVKKAGPKGGENGKSKAAGQAVKGPGKAGKGIKAVQSGKPSQSGKAGKASQGGKAGQGAKAGAEKAAAAKKGSGQTKDTSKAKSSPAPADTADSFANPAISAAFRQALKKYPNALRKLTD
jgi:hypothetical protein